MTLIDDFLSQYLREVDYYNRAAQICAQQCEAVLEQNGVRAIVTYRAKRADRLKGKLQNRNKKKRYKTFDDIYDDIPDLAGVRIAIYFPDDRNEVDKLIHANFNDVKSKKFPEKKRAIKKSKSTYEKRFSGYWANHYRVHLKVDDPSDEKVRYTEARIEIQVASVLMHAWAEVEHDLLYKPLSGKPSEGERAILDELNGIVLAGEIALERLQNAVKVRLDVEEQQFTNHYELAAYIYDKLTRQS